MDKRPLGRTGEQVSLLGLGGFHLLEIDRTEAEDIFNHYLDNGGNYIETAARYGAGASERKIGRIGRARRGEYLLATKAADRTKAGAAAELDQSLANLQTDHLDIWFMHAVQTPEEAAQLTGPGGALEAAEEAKRQGKVRFIGLTGHGQPAGLLAALTQYDFDALMTNINYYDNLNYPDIAAKLIPLAQNRGTAVIAMKAVGDGYLWRSYKQGLRYSLGQPVSHVVAGFNTLDMLKDDLAVVNDFKPMSPAEVEALYAEAPEFRGYVCRQCDRCPAAEELDLKRIFELEGWFDRQMWDGQVTDPENYSLRVRLGRWFHQQDLARSAFAAEGHEIDPQTDYSQLNDKCLFGLDLGRKLQLARAKLTGNFILA